MILTAISRRAPVVVAVSVVALVSSGAEATGAQRGPTGKTVAADLEAPATHLDHFVAFSLGAAARLHAQGNRSKQLMTMAGMTRLVGGVVDRSGNDVILVGKVLPSRAAASLDDLATVLQMRLVRGIWPRVSIDPTPETASTHMHRVALSDGIRDRPFGQKFLQADIVLKQKSLMLHKVTGDVLSYPMLWSEEQRARAVREHNPVRSETWTTAESGDDPLSSYHGRPIERGASQALSRFWFTPRDGFTVPELDGVFVVGDLRLAVAHQTSGGQSAGKGDDLPAQRFSELFTDHIVEIAAQNGEIQELDLLFAETGVAEALAPEAQRLAYFLKKYRLPAAPTAREVGLIALVGEFQRSDQSTELVELSGGIDFRAEVRRLNSGNSDALRNVVLQSRPSKHALSWRVPIGRWRLPNDSYFHDDANPPLPADLAQYEQWGASLLVRSVALAPATLDDGDQQRRRFYGFGPPPPPPPSPAGMTVPPASTGRHNDFGPPPPPSPPPRPSEPKNQPGGILVPRRSLSVEPDDFQP